jgi:hypothetical protein
VVSHRAAAERLLEYVDGIPSASERVSNDDARNAYTNGDFVPLAKWRLDLRFADNQPPTSFFAAHDYAMLGLLLQVDTR